MLPWALKADLRDLIRAHARGMEAFRLHPVSFLGF